MKLQYKFFFLVLISAFIPFLIITCIFFFRYQEITYKQLDDYSNNVFSNAVKEANIVLSDVSDAASQFSFYTSRDNENSIVESLTVFSDPLADYTSYDVFIATRNMDYIAENVLYSDNYIYGIYIITPSGVVISSVTNINGEFDMDYSFSEEPWYQNVLSMDSNEIYVSSKEDQSLFTGDKESLFFAKKLESLYDHADLGILILDCDPSMFNFDVINTYSDITQFTIQNADTSSYIYEDSTESFLSASGDEVKELNATLDLSQLTLTTRINYSLLADKLRLTWILVIISVIICTSFILAGSYLLSIYLTRPIVALSSIMSKQKPNTPSVMMHYQNRNDEIGNLYDEYGKMIHKLNLSVKQQYENKLIILDSQMKSLEAQINSHFLFNTLETINSMAELEGSESISVMALALGNMFRYAIKTKSELVSLSEELQQVNDYISIQQIRFPNRFQVITTISPEIREIRILKLILQPIIENSLLHGILKSPNSSLIKVQGYILGSFLFIEIEDDGCGIPKDTLIEIRNSLQEEPSILELGHGSNRSIGIKNIHSRIALYYGIGYGLTIESIHLSGTKITIKLPVV